MIELYHGTKYSFDKFDLSHFNSGMGCANCGYGMYFTSDYAIAEDYAEKLNSRDYPSYIYTVEINRELNLILWEDYIDECLSQQMYQELRRTTSTEELELQQAFGLGGGYEEEPRATYEIYGYCEGLLGSKKEVSLMLDSLGVDGILSPQGGENSNYTIFDVRGIKIIDVRVVSMRSKIETPPNYQIQENYDKSN